LSCTFDNSGISSLLPSDASIPTNDGISAAPYSDGYPSPFDGTGNFFDARPDITAACGPHNCPGCCAGSVCQIGSEQAACGKNGVQCLNCSPVLQCSENQCIGCQKSEQCPGNSICIPDGKENFCGSAYDHRYRITVVSAEINQKNNLGLDWDSSSPENAPPDPYVLIFYGAKLVSFTSTQWNTFSPEWKHVVELDLFKNRAVTLLVVDADSGTTEPRSGQMDLIGNINFEPEVPIEVLKAGTYHFISTDDKNGLLEMILSIEPL
jgi:hypothetical protein